MGNRSVWIQYESLAIDWNKWRFRSERIFGCPLRNFGWFEPKVNNRPSISSQWYYPLRPTSHDTRFSSMGIMNEFSTVDKSSAIRDNELESPLSHSDQRDDTLCGWLAIHNEWRVFQNIAGARRSGTISDGFYHPRNKFSGFLSKVWWTQFPNGQEAIEISFSNLLEAFGKVGRNSFPLRKSIFSVKCCGQRNPFWHHSDHKSQQEWPRWTRLVKRNHSNIMLGDE